MKTPALVWLIVGVLLAGTLSVRGVWAQEPLSRQQIDALLTRLIAQERSAWIQTGRVTARHTEYHAPQTTDLAWVEAEVARQQQDFLAQEAQRPVPMLARQQQNRYDAIAFNVRYRWLNEYTQVERHEADLLDGLYHYTITIEQRTDSLQPDASLRGNDETEEFPLETNRVREFFWDGRAYTETYPGGGNAMISEQDTTPRIAVMPLIVGRLFWGQGLLSRDRLEKASTLAQRTRRNGRDVIELTIIQANGVTLSLVLDPALDYAAIQHQWTTSREVRRSELSGFARVGGHWVPTRVVCERQDASGRLLGTDEWELAFSDEEPPAARLQARVPDGLLVRRTRAGRPEVFHYFQDPTVDTESLYAERLAAIEAAKRGPQNCGSLQFRHAARRLGIELNAADAAGLVDRTGLTRLSDMVSMARGLGLQTRAAALTWAQLQQMADDGAQVLLNLPGDLGHFVLLRAVGQDRAWVVDLSQNFFYRPLSRRRILAQGDEVDALVLAAADAKVPATLGRPLDAATQDLVLGGDYYDACTLPGSHNGSGGTVCDMDWESYMCFGYMTIYYDIWQCEDWPDCVELLYHWAVKREYPCLWALNCPRGPSTIYTAWACDGERLCDGFCTAH